MGKDGAYVSCILGICIPVSSPGSPLGRHDWNSEKQVKAKSSVCSVIVKILGILIAGYGGYAFGQRQIASYMFLQSMFVYFDFEEPLVFFILDYMAIMGLFVGGGYYVSKGLKGLGKKK